MNGRDDIQEELKALTPLLASLPRELPYTVPEGYFDSLSERMLMAAGLQEVSELKKEGNAPFAVPGGYFEKLPEVILRKAKSGDAKLKVKRIRQLHRSWWMAAASVLLLIVISISIIRNKQSVTAGADEPIDTSYILFESAAALPDAMVVELYSLDDQALSPDTLDAEYLIEASAIDAEIIYTL